MHSASGLTEKGKEVVEKLQRKKIDHHLSHHRVGGKIPSKTISHTLIENAKSSSLKGRLDSSIHKRKRRDASFRSKLRHRE